MDTTVAQMTTVVPSSFGDLGEPLECEEVAAEAVDSMEGSASSSDDQAPPTPVVKHAEEEHIYANLKEMEQMNNKVNPPVPGPTDIPKRNLNNGWVEYETDMGRTYFHNFDTGKSQWIPPRFIRTPAEVQAILDATRHEIDHCGSPSPAASKQNSYEKSDDSESRNEPEATNSEDEYVYLPNTRTSEAPMLSSFSSASKMSTPMTQPTTTSRKNSGETIVTPSALRTQSFKCHRPPQLKNIPVPQVLPTTSYVMESSATESTSKYPGEDSPGRIQEERRGSGESREPVRTIRCGTMEKVICDGVELKTKKREWQTNFLYLTSAHLILYKDEKSAEKHDNHYAAPLGVCDLRGALVSWLADKEKRKRKVIQLDLSYGPRYLLRSGSDSDTSEWFEALRDVVAKLPTIAPSHGLPIHASILDGSCAVVRNPSVVGTRPHSTTLPSSSRSSKRNTDMMSQSAFQPSTHEDPRISRETILERLLRFFRTRPSVESLKEKGIYKPEPVFGSTLANICLVESSLIPKFLRTVIDLIENKGLSVDGLYRVSGNLSAVQKIRCQVDQDKYGALVNEEDVHVLTGALKLFFRELAEPLFPLNCHKEYLSAIKIQNMKQRFKKFDDLLKTTLPVENKETLKMLLRHLHRVAAHSDKNRMQAHNLAIMFGPTLFHNGEEKPKKPVGKKKGKDTKKDDPPPVQSNSHLAFNMIMQGQIVEYLLNEHSRFEALQGPILTHPP